MENEQNKLVFLAENVSISEQSKLNPIFLTIDVKLCDSLLNQNHEGMTPAFIEDVVNRQADHLCLPFYADVENLLAGNYDQLGHLYNRVMRTFGTNIIGAISEFYSDTDDNGVVSLYGKIKVPKRDRDIVYRLVDLYEMGHFAVSVELSYDPHEIIMAEGGRYIDASENASLNGLCLVWNPACSTAVALDMVAETDADHSEVVTEGEEPANRGETELEKDKMTAEVQEEIMEAETQSMETTVAEAEEASSETVVAEADQQQAETTVAETEDKQEDEDPEDDKDDEEEKEDVVAENQDTVTAEVLEHSVDTHESVEHWGGEPVHVIEYHERVIETMEEAGTVIAELEHQIAELNEIKEKYDAMVAEKQAVELAEKRAKARAFAEKQGLDVTVAEVQSAIEALDYTAIAEMTMAQVREEEEIKTPAEPDNKVISLASFVELDVGDNNLYGGLLKRRNK